MSTLPETVKPAEWHNRRRCGIGGSDAAAACGLSKWKTPFRLWQEKLGQVESLSTPAMEWGTRLEPIVRQAYCDSTGYEVLTPENIVTCSVFPFMLANLDGIVLSERLCEFKTARTAEGWGEPGSGEIPVEYQFQCQHYMSVMEYQYCDVAVLIGGSDFRIYTLESDAEFQSLMIEQEERFWRLVQTETPPEPVSLEDVKARWPQSFAGNVAATGEIAAAVDALRLLKEKQAVIDAQYEQQLMRVQAFMASAECLTNSAGEPLATWKSSKASSRLDAKALQAAHPDIYKQFLKPTAGSRRFLLKGEPE